jgi:hypothetical protein
VREHGRGRFLNALGRDELLPVHERQGLTTFHEQQRAARARPQPHARRRARSRHNIHDIALQLFAYTHLAHGLPRLRVSSYYRQVLEGQGGYYVYDADTKRAVAVDSRAILQSLDKIMGARAVVEEIRGGTSLIRP